MNVINIVGDTGAGEEAAGDAAVLHRRGQEQDPDLIYEA